MRCWDGYALTLILVPKLVQPEETLLRVHCSESHQLDHSEEHEKNRGCRCDKKVLMMDPSDSTTMYSELSHCVVHPSRAVAVSLALVMESGSLRAREEKLEPESNHVVAGFDRGLYEEILRDIQAGLVQRKTVVQYGSFQMPVTEYQSQPWQVYLGVSEAKNVEK